MEPDRRIRSYRDLEVWNLGMDLAQSVYARTAAFPKSETLGLASQMRRAAVSIPSNIVEGYGRHATGEYRRHLCIARGSLLELETQVILTRRIGLAGQESTQPLLDATERLGQMLTALIAKIR